MPQPAPIFRNVARLYQAKIINSVPVWHKVMLASPPSLCLLRAHSDLDTDSSLLFEYEKNPPHLSGRDNSRHSLSNHYERCLRQLLPSPPKQPKRNVYKHLKPKRMRPQRIVYPEDSLRRKFYADHPFELSRPTTLVEMDTQKDSPDFSDSTPQSWEQFFEIAEDVNGEHVIQYQLHLIAQGRTIRDAYKIACQAFYAVRQRQEENERKKRVDIPMSLEKSIGNAEVLSMTGYSSEDLKKLKPENYKAWLLEDKVMLTNQELQMQKSEAFKAAQESALM